MKKRQAGLMVFGFLFFVLLSFGLSWAQNPPTLLIVVRASDDSLWKMTCDEVGCSAFTSFPGMFRYQPTVTWDEVAQEWVVIGTASNSSIWMATFDEQGNFNNDWQPLPGLTPSSAGASGAFYTLGSLSCSSGQVAKWNGSAWVCAADDIGSVVSPSSTVANMDGVSSVGSSALYSRGDHKHGIASGAITGSHIQDGAIMNVDISASAAIDFSKLSGVASATHNHDAAYVNVSGDTMTGSLNLPANGLVAGTNQFVLSGGNVGIGTSSPTQKLEVAGNVKISGTGNGLAFPDGTTQTTAVTGGGGGVPSGFMILGDTSTSPSGYTYTGKALGLPGSWATKANMPTARYNGAIAVVNNKIYVFGGISGSTVFATTEEYDPVTNAWTAKAIMPTARYGSAAAVVNNKIYVIGGYTGVTGVATNEEYDPSTNTWTNKANMPGNRWAHAAATVNNKVYIIGGGNGATILDTNQEYDPSTNIWSTKASMPTAREWPGASVVNGKIYVIGGRNDSTIFAANEEYDPAINTWTGKASMHTARLVFATAVVNNKIYAIGGGNSSTLLSNNEEYDPVTSSWTDRAGMPAARWGNRAAEVGNKVYVIGGNLDPMPIVGPSTLGIPTNEEFTLELLYVHKKD